MDREEAQNILQLCRPDNIEDRSDPPIAEALELRNPDAELRTWFDEQQALDAEISAEFNNVEAPADLKASILVGMRAHAAQSGLLMGDAVEDGDEGDDNTVPFRLALKPLIGIAAVLVAAAVVFMRPAAEEAPQLASNDTTAAAPATDVAAVASVEPASIAVAAATPTIDEPIIVTAGVPNVIEFLAQQISDFNASKFDKRGEQINELQSHLASTGMPNPASIPKQLEEFDTIGCVTFDYEGSKLSMICFKNGKVYHLITADRAALPTECAANCTGDCANECAKIFEYKQQAFKLWPQGDQVFILTTQGTKEDIQDIPEFI